jgi:hypothetical protein
LGLKPRIKNYLLKRYGKEGCKKSKTRQSAKDPKAK